MTLKMPAPSLKAGIATSAFIVAATQVQIVSNVHGGWAENSKETENASSATKRVRRPRITVNQLWACGPDITLCQAQYSFLFSCRYAASLSIMWNRIGPSGSSTPAPGRKRSAEFPRA